MQNYAPGGAIQVSFDLRNEAGVALIPTALRWRVLDESDTVLQDWAALAVPAANEKAVATIPGVLNTLVAPATRGIRTVELEVTTATGNMMLSEQVMIQGLSQLSLWNNTFLTYAQSLMFAQDFAPGTLSGWELHTPREDRERALVEAHTAIMRMPLVVDSRRSVWLSELSAQELSEMLTHRQSIAIRKAQLLEASAVLEANPVLIARREGLMSMTVGESSQFFRSGKPLESAMISSQAIEQLKPYIRHVTMLGRG